MILSVFVAIDPVATTSPGRSVQVVSFKSDLYSTRYIHPSNALQFKATPPADPKIDSITGGEITIMLNVVASLKLGTPLSVTRRVTAFVLDTVLAGAFQVKRPFAGSTVAPVGAPGSKVNASALAGMSTSAT